MPFLMVCLVGLLVSVDASPVSPPVISGQVRLSDGLPVAGAQVVLFDLADLRRGPVGQATTDEAGQFALPLAAGGAWVLPSEVALGQNYPNPFNPSTLIPYQLSASSPVRLEVFNILGQRVTTLVDGEQGAGAYVARWDGTDAAGGAAASGVYFYRLTVAGAHWTGKMVLLDGQAGVPLGGARVEAVPLAAGSTATYGLVVSGDGLVTYVDADFGGAAGQGPVDLVVAAEPNVRMKVTVPTLEGLLGDVNADGHVDLDDGLLVAMHSVHPALSLPNHGLMTLGDVNCDGQVELADAGLLATYVVHPSDAAVASLRIGQRGGYSLDPVTEVVWASILGTEKKDPTVARILDGVPVLLSGVLPIDGEDRLYLGIDRAYWTQQGGKQLYEALQQRFPATPIHVEPSIGVVRHAGKVTTRPTTTAIRTVAPVTRFGPPISFAESPNAGLRDHSKAQTVVGRIGVPHDVTVGSVAVAVDITHPFRGDLKIDLVAPSGVATTLYNGTRSGIGSGANITGTIVTTDALQGQAAKGTWQLRVGDYERGDAGTLNSWTLTVTPAQDAEETEEPINVFLDTFQEGLGAWRTTEWEAASLDTDSGVPGEGPGNVVAKAEGCSVCFLTLQTPVDLSDHDSVTLSFYRWMDPGTADNEFLGLDIGNNGAYRRLKTWSSQDADGEWHLETLTLSGDQISNSFTLRFFGIAQNSFTTFAIDNVMIAATPGSVVVTPITPEQTPDLDETVNRPDLVVEHGLALSRTVQAGAAITFYPRTTNIGTASAPATTIRIYRHTQETATPRIGGIEETRTARSAALAPDRSAITVAHATAPSTAGVHYYYLCLDHVTNETVTNNNCTQTPATVSIEQTATDPGQEEVPETTPTTTPDVTVTETVATPPSAIAGDTISIQATITNIGSAAADATTIHVYRHEQETTRPTTRGIREANTASTPTLAPNKSVQVTSTHQAPTAPAILGARTYYYYVCLTPLSGEQTTDNNCSSTPAIINVRPKREDPGPPYAHCFNIPDRGIPMGGDAMPVKPIGHSYVPSCGTITLGGLETETGVHGFVVSAHVIAGAADRNNKNYTTTDVFVGHDINGNSLSHFLGKVYRMPKLQDKGWKYPLLPADAAFVAYPHPKTPDCSLTWSGDGEEFCLDVGAGEYIERVVPLTVRGANGTTHTVTGSKEPTEGLTVRFFGSVTGVPKENVVESTKVLSVGFGKNIYLTFAYGSKGIGGDSGGPVYTVPDAAGNVYILGVLEGSTYTGDGDDRRWGITFSPWSDVEEELDLKPISAPDGPTEEDEEDLAGLFSAFD